MIDEINYYTAKLNDDGHFMFYSYDGYLAASINMHNLFISDGEKQILKEFAEKGNQILNQFKKLFIGLYVDDKVGLKDIELMSPINHSFTMKYPVVIGRTPMDIQELLSEYPPPHPNKDDKEKWFDMAMKASPQVMRSANKLYHR